MIYNNNSKNDKDFLSNIREVLNGNFNEYINITTSNKIGNNGEKLKYISSYKLKVFVSSTFTDTHLERNILLDEIVPYLKQLATPYNIQIVFVDMRYGVRDENTKDHMTWLARKSELYIHVLNNHMVYISYHYKVINILLIVYIYYI